MNAIVHTADWHEARRSRARVFQWEPENCPAHVPQVALIHGLCCNVREWEQLGARLAACGLRVVAPELRGHGLTAAADGDYSLQGLAEDVFAAARPGPDTVVVGHSLGGAIAIELAARHTVKQVVTVSGYIHAKYDGASHAEAVAALTPPEGWAAPPEVWKETVAGYWEPETPDPAWLRRYFDDGLKSNPDGNLEPRLPWHRRVEIVDSLADHNPIEALRGSTAELTAVLAGADETCVSGWQDEESILTARPAARIIRVAGGRHYLPFGRPQAVLEAVLAAVWKK